MSSQLANFIYLYLFVCIICTSTGVYTNNNNNNNSKHDIVVLGLRFSDIILLLSDPTEVLIVCFSVCLFLQLYHRSFAAKVVGE